MKNAPRRIDQVGGVVVRRLGRSDYVATWHAMQDFTSARDATTPDEIWLTEHSPIYTLGLAGRREHLLRDNGIAVIKADRGGQVTYHGLAVNVAMDLAPFSDIDPCGYPGLTVTQLCDVGPQRTVEEAGDELAPIIALTLCSR